MPKTLAALPSSQYATLFEDVLGKLLDLAAFSAAPASAAPSACEAVIVALFRSGCVDVHRTDCKTDGRGPEDREAERVERIGALRQGLLTNSRRERRGAAVRSCGKAWNIEAMAGDGRWESRAEQSMSSSMP
jgi:hypothetical protein